MIEGHVLQDIAAGRRVRAYSLAMRLLAWLAPLLLARGAHAASAGWLTWEAPLACVQAGAVERRVDELLAGSSPAVAGLRVSGVVRRDGDAWVLRLVARQGAGVQRRRLRHPDCALLGEAAALLVAMAVDPAAVTMEPRLAGLLRRTPPPPPQPDVTPIERAPAAWVSASIEAPAEPRPAQEEPRPISVAPEDPRPVSAPPIAPTTPRRAPVVPRSATAGPRAPVVGAVLLRISGGLAIGATPLVAGGVSGAIGLGLGRRARIEAPIFYSAPTRVHLDAAPTSGAAVSLVGAGLRGCGVLGRGIVEVPLCLGVELGSMRATGFGVDDGRSPRSLWAALTPGLAVLVSPRSWLGLGVWLDVPVAVARPRFEVAGGGEVWRAGAAGLRAGLGVEVRIPARRGRRR